MNLEDAVHKSQLVFALFALALTFSPADAAQESPGRHTMAPTEGGFVRLDTQTGTMSLCTREDGKWACEVMADSQLALQDEIDKLKAENQSLKGQVEQLEETLGVGPKPDSSKPTTKFALPSEEDVDTAFDYLEGILKKLRDRMEKLEDEHGKKDDGTPL